MFYKKIETPKPSQTIFIIDGRGKDAKIKKLFITKVIITALTETPIGIIVGTKGINEDGLFVQTQSFIREFKNHILVETRCGELLDLSVGERTSQTKEDSILGEIFLSKKKANKKLREHRNMTNFFFIADEYNAFRYGSNIPKA